MRIKKDKTYTRRHMNKTNCKTEFFFKKMFFELGKYFKFTNLIPRVLRILRIINSWLSLIVVNDILSAYKTGCVKDGRYDACVELSVFVTKCSL